MKNLVLLQIFVYLYISPIVLIYMGRKNYLLSVSIVFLVGFALGIFQARFLIKPRNPPFKLPPPELNIWLRYFLMLLTILYVYVIVDQGLIYRRLGSEVVAQIAADMPIYYKLIMRIYEVIFYPLTFVLLSGLAVRKSRPSELVLLALFFVGFLCSGVLDSRMKLIFPLLFYYVFFIAPKPTRSPIPKRYLLIGGGVLIFASVLVGIGRIQDYGAIDEYILNDLVVRLDGLQLISLLNKEVDIPFYGTLDVKIWSNLIAMFPFLEEARNLKAQGLTSAKSYFLQVVLGTKQFDSNNSVVTDLYYLGGYFLVFFGAILYGHLVMRVDRLLKYTGVWRNRATLAFLCAFFMNGWQLESGYFAVAFSTARDFCILYILFYGLNFYKANRDFSLKG